MCALEQLTEVVEIDRRERFSYSSALRGLRIDDLDPAFERRGREIGASCAEEQHPCRGSLARISKRDRTAGPNGYELALEDFGEVSERVRLLERTLKHGGCVGLLGENDVYP